MAKTPSSLTRELEGQVSLLLRKIDLYQLGEKERKAVINLRQALADARIYARDYELSEMRDEQIDNAKKAKKYLGQARQNILKASEYNVFSAIDVAHLTATIDQIIGDLKWVKHQTWTELLP